MGYEMLRRTLAEAPVMQRGEYRYFIHPLTDSIPPIEPALMEEVANEVIGSADLDVDYMITMEAMGIHVAAIIGHLTGIAYNIIRKRSYGIPDEIRIAQKTGYSRGEMYLNSVSPGDVVTIVDAVISTGGTLVAVINALRDRGAIIKDIV